MSELETKERAVEIKMTRMDRPKKIMMSKAEVDEN